LRVIKSMAELRLFNYARNGQPLCVADFSAGTPLFIYTEESGRWLVEVISREIVEREGTFFEDTVMRCLAVIHPYKSSPLSDFVHPVTEGVTFTASTQMPGPAAWGLFREGEDVEGILAQRDLQRRIQAGSAHWSDERGWF
jgi:hypothetical protein